MVGWIDAFGIRALMSNLGLFDGPPIKKPRIAGFLILSCGAIWRLSPESNRGPRLCRPLHNHSATQPTLHGTVNLP